MLLLYSIILPTKDDEKSFENSCNLACCAAVWLSLAPSLARIVRSTSQKWNFNKTCRVKFSDRDFLRIWMPWRYTSCNRPCHQRSKVWPKMSGCRKNVSQNLMCKNLCSLLSDSIVFIFLLLFFRAFQRPFWRQLFFWFFRPGLCGGSTTANSYSKSRSEPQKSMLKNLEGDFIWGMYLISIQLGAKFHLKGNPSIFLICKTPEALGLIFVEDLQIWQITTTSRTGSPPKNAQKLIIQVLGKSFA